MHSKYVVYLLCTYSNTSELLVFSSTGAPTFWIWGSPCHYPHQWSKLSLFGCMNLIQNLITPCIAYVMLSVYVINTDIFSGSAILQADLCWYHLHSLLWCHQFLQTACQVHQLYYSPAQLLIIIFISSIFSYCDLNWEYSAVISRSQI